MLKRVLVVDDGAGVVQLSDVYRDMNAFEVLTAAGGRQAIDLLRTEDVDVLVVAVRMPDMDGFHVATAVREMGYTFPICLHAACDTFGATAPARTPEVQDAAFKPSPPDVPPARLRIALTGAGVVGSC